VFLRQISYPNLGDQYPCFPWGRSNRGHSWQPINLQSTAHRVLTLGTDSDLFDGRTVTRVTDHSACRPRQLSIDDHRTAISQNGSDGSYAGCAPLVAGWHSRYACFRARAAVPYVGHALGSSRDVRRLLSATPQRDAQISISSQTDCVGSAARLLLDQRPAFTASSLRRDISHRNAART
jgi:hypothetical protein